MCGRQQLHIAHRAGIRRYRYFEGFEHTRGRRNPRNGADLPKWAVQLNRLVSWRDSAELPISRNPLVAKSAHIGEQNHADSPEARELRGNPGFG